MGRRSHAASGAAVFRRPHRTQENALLFLGQRGHPSKPHGRELSAIREALGGGSRQGIYVGFRALSGRGPWFHRAPLALRWSADHLLWLAGAPRRKWASWRRPRRVAAALPEAVGALWLPHLCARKHDEQSRLSAYGREETGRGHRRLHAHKLIAEIVHRVFGHRDVEAKALRQLLVML